MSSLTKKKKNKKAKKNNSARAVSSGHTWGTGPVYDAAATIGFMVMGIYPQNQKTFGKVFASGHARSKKGSYSLVRPSAMNYAQAKEIAGNPNVKRFARFLKKVGLVEHLAE